MTDINEIADGIYRISTYIPGYPVTLAQFLIKDEKPFLFETGPKATFTDTLEAVRKIIDPSTLAYIGWSHLEGDECGAANDFLSVAPAAELICGEMGVFLGVGDFFTAPVRGLKDDEVLDLGERKLRCLVTPHVPHHWDASLLFEEKTETLFASDLMTHLGETKAISDEDIVERALETYRQVPDYLVVDAHMARVFDRLERLQPKLLAGHHSPAFAGDTARALIDFRSGLLRTAEIQS